MSHYIHPCKSDNADVLLCLQRCAVIATFLEYFPLPSKKPVHADHPHPTELGNQYSSVDLPTWDFLWNEITQHRGLL